MKEPRFGDVLGSLGAAIMAEVSSRPEATVRDVVDALAQREGSSGPAYTTVLTVMTRLYDQGLLARRSVGRAHIYRATADEGTLVDELSRRAVRRVLDRYGSGALRHFAMSLSEADPEVRARLLRAAEEGE